MGAGRQERTSRQTSAPCRLFSCSKSDYLVRVSRAVHFSFLFYASPTPQQKQIPREYVAV